MTKRTQEFQTYAVRVFRAPDDFIGPRKNAPLRDYEFWRDRDGKLDRQNGPAFIMYDIDTGVAMREEWYRHGKRHREDGPAVVTRDRLTGRQLSCRWFMSDEPVPAPRRGRAQKPVAAQVEASPA